MVSSSKFRCASKVIFFLCFFFFSLPSLFTNYKGRGGERERENKERKKIDLGDNETPMMICLSTARVTHFCHRWWPSLVSLNLSRRDLFNGIGGVIIEVSICLQNLFLSFLFLSPLSLYRILCLSILQFERVHIWPCDSRITDVICDCLNCVIFLNIFCIMLFYYFLLLC